MQLSIQGHSSYITHIDWSEDSQIFRSNSGDYEVLYCKLIKNTLNTSQIIFEFNSLIFVQKGMLDYVVKLQTHRRCVTLNGQLNIAVYPFKQLAFGQKTRTVLM